MCKGEIRKLLSPFNIILLAALIILNLFAVFYQHKDSLTGDGILISNDPEILILDEPTAGLDPKQRISIRNYISKIAFNKIVIIATHVVSNIEFIAKDIIMLKKGVIVDNTPPHELTKKIEGKECRADAGRLLSLCFRGCYEYDVMTKTLMKIE